MFNIDSIPVSSHAYNSYIGPCSLEWNIQKLPVSYYLDIASSDLGQGVFCISIFTSSERFWECIFKRGTL